MNYFSFLICFKWILLLWWGVLKCAQNGSGGLGKVPTLLTLRSQFTLLGKRSRTAGAGGEVSAHITHDGGIILRSSHWPMLTRLRDLQVYSPSISPVNTQLVSELYKCLCSAARYRFVQMR